MLEGKTVNVRAVELKDWPEVLDILFLPGVLEAMTLNPHEVTRSNVGEKLYPKDAKVFAVTTKKGKIIGTKSLGHFDAANGSAALILSAIHPDFRHKGINEEARILLRDYAFRSLRLHRLHFSAWRKPGEERDFCGSHGSVYEGYLRHAGYKDGQWLDLHLGAFINDGEQQ